MRDMSSSLYVASECIINYQHLDMRVTAVKIAAATIREVYPLHTHWWRITSEINIVSFVKVRRAVFRRLSAEYLLEKGVEQTSVPKTGPELLSQHIHGKRGILRRCVKSGTLLIACYELAIFVWSGR